MNQSLDFFARQFERQIASGDYALNPFERRALAHLRGSVLDLGCGLGNLALAAARQGLRVTAIDACPHAVADIARRAAEAAVGIEVEARDLSCWRAESTYDSVVCIGLLMFLRCPAALAVLGELRKATAPSGILVLNVLVEGTTYMQMFDRSGYCLMSHAALQREFRDWEVLDNLVEEFPAGEAQVKRFVTLVVRRPSGTDCPAPQDGIGSMLEPGLRDR